MPKKIKIKIGEVNTRFCVAINRGKTLYTFSDSSPSKQDIWYDTFTFTNFQRNDSGSICDGEEKVADTHTDDTNFVLNILLCNTLLHGGKVVVSSLLIFGRDLFKLLVSFSRRNISSLALPTDAKLFVP